MTFSLIRGDATSIPLADDSVDLVVTSPPYFALRSYTDSGEHYDGQIGSEATPQAFLEALWAVTAECVRVLKPSGSLWVNLGDKYSATGPSGPQGSTGARATRKQAATYGGGRRVDNAGIPAKSLMGLPWRYAIGCIDQLGLILRAEIVWSKPNGLPESVTDRVRRSHEQWFHFTKEPRYFSAVDEIREAHVYPDDNRHLRSSGYDAAMSGNPNSPLNPLGKLPGSVWTIPTEPLRVPDHLGVDHFAAFPSEWPRRLILGWSPSGVCVECGEGRRPVVDRTPIPRDYGGKKNYLQGKDGHNRNDSDRHFDGHDANRWKAEHPDRITGYACACPDTSAPTRPAVVLDPFMGTGTTVLTAHHLGRHGVGIDLSADYIRLAKWRCEDPKMRAKVLGVKAPSPQLEGQGVLL